MYIISCGWWKTNQCIRVLNRNKNLTLNQHKGLSNKKLVRSKWTLTSQLNTLTQRGYLGSCVTYNQNVFSWNFISNLKE